MVPAGFSRSSLRAPDLGLDFLDAGPDGSEETFARLGRRDAARGARQEADAEAGLEAADCLAERRLRHAELRGGAGEAAFARHREEGDEIVEVLGRHS